MKNAALIFSLVVSVIVLTGITIFTRQTIVRVADTSVNVLVEDDAGVRVPRARVRVFDETETELLATAFTDSAGVATLVVPTSVDVEDSGVVSRAFSVDAVYPNPVSADANRVVTIAYSAPVSYSDAPRLEIFDLLGRRVASPGILSSGVYVYRVDFGKNQPGKARTLVVADGGPVEVRLARSDRSRSTGTQHAPAKTARALASLVLKTDKPGYQPADRAIETAGQDLEVTLEMARAARPQAAFVVSGTLEEGSHVRFDGTSSVDAAGGSLRYSWDFGDGKRGGTSRVSHAYVRTGSYEISLVVSGTHGAADTTRKTVEITQGPQASSLTGIVTGVVFDQLENPLREVMVSVVGDTAGVPTEAGGRVQLQGVPVGIPVYLTLEKEGYSTQQVKVTLESDTTEAYFRASLLERSSPVRVGSVENGASIAGADGVKLSIPYDGLLDEDGNRVTGDVLVSLTPVDVVEQTAAFPGRFEAVDENGAAGGLQSYGVAEFTLSQEGRDVQLAPGKTASVEIPIYTGGADLGDEIALWSVDEETGQWIQEGAGIVVESEASPTGLALRAEVGHFSWWNCDDFFDPDVRNPGVCYEKECDSGVCFDVAVGCWVGGRRKPLQKLDSRLQTAPVFEVRTYISPAGARLFFPPNRETEIVATSLGGLLTARMSITGIAGNESPLDIFLEPGLEVDTVQIAYGDTLAATYEASDSPFVYGFFVGDTEAFEVELISDGFAGNITLQGAGQSTERQLSASRTVTFSGNGITDQTFFIVVDGFVGTPGDFRITLRRTGVFEWIDFDDNGEVYIEGMVGPDETRVFAYRAEAGDGIYAEVIDSAPGRLPAEDVSVKLKRWSTSPFSSCCQTASSIASVSERLAETSGEYSVEIEDRKDNGGAFALRMFRVKHSTAIVVDDDLACVGAETRSLHAAFAAADPEALVSVCPGEYQSLKETAVVYSDGVQIVGADRSTTHLMVPQRVGRAERPTVRVEGAGVSLRNLSIGGPQTYTCCTPTVDVDDSAVDFEISSARIYGENGAKDSGRGLQIDGDNATVRNVIIEDILVGANLSSEGLTFTDNVVETTSGVKGGLSNGVIRDNEFSTSCEVADLLGGGITVERNVMLGENADPRCTMVTISARETNGFDNVMIRDNTIRTSGSAFNVSFIQPERRDVHGDRAKQCRVPVIGFVCRNCRPGCDYRRFDSQDCQQLVRPRRQFRSNNRLRGGEGRSDCIRQQQHPWQRSLVQQHRNIAPYPNRGIHKHVRGSAARSAREQLDLRARERRHRHSGGKYARQRFQSILERGVALFGWIFDNGDQRHRGGSAARGRGAAHRAFQSCG